MKWSSPVSDQSKCVEKQAARDGPPRNAEEKNARAIRCALVQGQFWADPIQLNIANHCRHQTILVGKGIAHLTKRPQMLLDSAISLQPGEAGRYEGHEHEMWVAVDRETGRDHEQWVLDSADGVVQDLVVTCEPKSKKERDKFI